MRAFIFPGQGSQYAGMGRELSESSPVARAVFDEADEVLGFRLSRLCFEGPQEELTLTENAQPALLAASVAVFRVLREEGVGADLVAGHSLGEYSALVAAESLILADALRLVRERGRLMQEAVPVGTGAMAAVIGLPLEEVEKICREAAEDEIVAPANQNSPEQIAISGHARAVERAGRMAAERGAKRVIPLPVSAPFHCALMLPAQQKMAPLLNEADFRALQVPLVNNVDAELVRSGIDAREGLIRQISSMVRWTGDLKRLYGEGARDFVEVGPGRVLTGLVRRTLSDVRVKSVEKPEQVDQYVSAE